MNLNQPSPAEHPTLSTQHLAGVQRMDPEGWSRLVHTYGPIVYRWCRASGVPESDAADVVQDVFTSVARSIADFQPQKQTGSFRSWLATITRNRVRDYFRKQSLREQAAGGTGAWQQMQQYVDNLDSSISVDQATNPIVQHVLESVKAEFEHLTWQAFWMTAVEAKTAAEVSAAIGMPVASVYQSKSRVLRRLRQRLSELPE